MARRQSFATSRNGLRALAATPHIEAAKGMLLFAVGPGTATTARGLGFTTIVAGSTNAQELVPLIAEHAEVNSGPLVHLAGDHVSGHFVEELRRLGYFVSQPVVYTTEVAERFASPTVAEHAKQANRLGSSFYRRAQPRSIRSYSGCIIWRMPRPISSIFAYLT